MDAQSMMDEGELRRIIIGTIDDYTSSIYSCDIADDIIRKIKQVESYEIALDKWVKP